MKKLMSVLLVAVLLISAIPFATFADGDEQVDTQSEVQNVYTQVILTFDGVQDSPRYDNIANGTTVENILIQLLGSDKTNEIKAKYNRAGEYPNGWAHSVDVTGGYVELAFVTKTYNVSVKINGGDEAYFGEVKHGTALTLNNELVQKVGLSLGADFTVDCFTVGGQTYNVGQSVTITGGTTIIVNKKAVNTGNNGSSNNNSGNNSSSNNNTTTTATHVDVILVTNKTSGFVDGEYYRCYLVNGKITSDDRNAIANKISGKNIVKWKRDDNQTVADSLVNFDFNGLANPINILPVVGTTTSSGSNNSTTNNSGISTKDNTNQVWLHVYINGNASTINKSINLTNTYLMDDNGTNTTEILNYLLTNYYKSSDSSKNVELDGLYVNTGSSGTFPQNYYTDNKTDKVENISTKLANGYVHINVMLKNVTSKTASTATADSSNPKTGDSIYTAMTVMGISAATLAAVMYVYTKKRQAI